MSVNNKLQVMADGSINLGDNIFLANTEWQYMRTFLFRGRDLNGNWRFGNMRHVYGDSCRVMISTNNNKLDNNLWEPGSHFRSCYVHPETVGQFTGLLDSRNELIFEGDCVILDGNENEVFVVEYYKGSLVLTLRQPDDAIKRLVNLYDVADGRMTVVGDIFDSDTYNCVLQSHLRYKAANEQVTQSQNRKR
ncbi:MAG: hypothetical protein IJ668_06060 [Selenomonadaceae bacterium]|nr:hypothetical protein [Selenomonadaceae bacterium]